MDTHATRTHHALAFSSHTHPNNSPYSFGLPLHPDIAAAARDPGLREALASKVSRERVGIEVEGMLSGKDARPALALEALAALGLAGTVFRPPLAPAPAPAPASALAGREQGQGQGVEPSCAAAEGGDAGAEAEAEGEAGWLPLGVAGVRLANVLLWRREAAGPGGEEEGEGEAEVVMEDVGMLRSEDADELALRPDNMDAGVGVGGGGVGGRGMPPPGGPHFRLLGLTRAGGYRRSRRGHRLLFLAAALLGWAGRAPGPEPPQGKGKGKRAVPVVQVVVREALKLRARDAEEAGLLYALLPRFRALAGGAGARAGAGAGVPRCVVLGNVWGWWSCVCCAGGKPVG